MKRMQKIISSVCALLIAASLVFVPATSAAYAAGSQRDVEVLLSADAVSNNLDLNGFSDKLKSVLQNTYSISPDKVHISEVASQSYDTSGSDWYRFDHTNGGSLQNNEKNYVVPFDDQYMHQIFPYHIVNSGNSITFEGYGSPAFKDFLYMPNSDANNKIFTFTIDEAHVTYHSCEGAGFLFNAKYSYNSGARTLSGYLILIGGTESNPSSGNVDLFKLDNIDVNQMTQENSIEFGSTASSINSPASAWGGTITKIATLAKPAISGGGSMRYLKLVASPTNVSLTQYADSNFATVSSTIFNNIGITTFNSFGFGPFVGYRSHSCSQLTTIVFSNLKMVAESSVGFADMVKSASWQYDDSLKIIANVDNDGVPDFGTPGKLATILYYMMQNNVQYVGWGLNNSINIGSDTSVKGQADSFVARNDGDGTFINRSNASYDTLDEGVAALAGYISSQLGAMPDIDKPDINITFNPSNNVTCTSPTNTTSAGNPVSQYEWRRMNVATGSWEPISTTSNNVSVTFDNNSYNFVSLRIQDSVSGKWSDYAQAYVATDPAAQPVSKFSLDKNVLMPDVPIDGLKTATSVTAKDSSYHPSGAALTNWEWKVYNSSLQEVTALDKTYTSSSKPDPVTFDFSSQPGGTYTIKLKVYKDSYASEYYSQQVTIIKESSAISITKTAPTESTLSYTSTLGVSYNITSTGNPITSYRVIKIPTVSGSNVIGDWESCSSKSLTGCSTTLSGGSYDVYVQAKDSFGNSKTQKLGTYTQDTTPHISPSSVNFNKNTVTTDYSDKVIALALNGNTFTGISNGETSLTADKDYSVSGTNVTVKKEYLSGLDTGTKTLTFNFSGGTADLTVNISDTAPSVTADVKSFDKNTKSDNFADISFTVNLNGNNFSGVKYGSYSLTASDYTWDGTGKVVISKNYLKTLDTGDRTITFVFAEGNEIKVSVKVVDSTPSISPDSTIFNKNITTPEYSDKTVALTLNGSTFKGISDGSTDLTADKDYTVSGTNVTIKKEYLSGLDNGTKTLTFNFNWGTADYTATISDSSPSVTADQTTFNKNIDSVNFKDMSFTVNLNGNNFSGVKLGSSSLTASDYTWNGTNKVIICKDYLKTLDTGDRSFTFVFVEGNEIKSGIKVVNTTPGIGKNSADFDKNVVKQADIIFDLDQNGNPLSTIKYGDKTLSSPDNYSISDGKVTLKKEWLATLETGKAASLELDFTEGNTLQFVVNVSDSTPGVDITSTTFDKNPSAQKNIAVTLDLKDTTLSGVSNGNNTLAASTDYTLTDNVVSVSKDYLVQFNTGATENLVFSFATGNTLTVSVTILNTAKPVITLNGDDPMILELGTAYTEPGAKVDDPFDKDISSKLVIAGTVDIWRIGNYTITYDATNKDGNVAVQKMRTVTVSDTKKPDIKTPSLSPSGWTNGSINISATISDLSGIDSVKWDSGDAEASSVLSSGKTAKLVKAGTQTSDTVTNPQSGKWSFTVSENGTYTLAVKDSSGKTSTQKIDVSNIDGSAPVISASPSSSDWARDIKVSVSVSDHDSQVRNVQYAWSDKNTAPSSGYVAMPSGASVSLSNFTGTQYLTVIAGDNAGNSSTSTFGPYKIDNTAPKASYTVDPDKNGGKATIKVTATDGESGIGGITMPDGSVKQDSEAEYTVLYSKQYVFTVADKAGNKTTLTADVTVPDLPDKVDITGTVTQPDGSVNPGVTVQIIDGNGNVVATTTTDGKGNYVLPDVPPGNYSVIVGGDTSKPIPLTITGGDGNNSITKDGVGFNVDKNSSALHLNLKVDPDGHTSVKNMDESGSKINTGFQIQALDESGNKQVGKTYVIESQDGTPIATVTTNGNGVADFGNLPTGAYILVALDSQGQQTGSINVNIHGGNKTGQSVSNGNAEFVVNKDQNLCSMVVTTNIKGEIIPTAARVSGNSHSAVILVSIAGGCVILIALLIIFLLARKRKIYKAGEKPGKGEYLCTNCDTEQAIEDDEQELTACANCSEERFTKRRASGFKMANIFRRNKGTGI